VPLGHPLPVQPEQEIPPPPVPWHSRQLQVGEAAEALALIVGVPGMRTTISNGAAVSGDGAAIATPVNNAAKTRAKAAIARMF
jgi:hypothetical protein